MRKGIEDVFANGYEVGEDGEITNAQAEKALHEYEKRTGKTVDRDDEAAVLAALHDQWEEFDREEERLNKRAAEIDYTVKVTIPNATRIMNDPDTPAAVKVETAQKVTDIVDHSSFDGKSIIENYGAMKSAGHDTDLNNAGNELVEEFDSFDSMFNMSDGFSPVQVVLEVQKHQVGNSYL